MKLFKFLKKNDDLDDNFLSLSDKEEISKISQEKEKYLRTAQKLDREIVQIQKSTKTLIPGFTPLHNSLRQKYRWYYWWHIKKFANLTHWLILLLFIFSLPLIFANLSGFQNKKVQAVTYDFPRWEWSNPKPIGNSLRSVWTYNANNVWAVGVNGTILQYNGSTWRQHYSGITQDLSAVSGFNQSNVWAVGQEGTILKYDGIYDSWSSQTSGTSQYLRSISTLDANNIWAVGYAGTILKYNGTAWSSQESGTTQDLYGVSALDANNVWAVGSTGTILKYNGTTWSLQESGTTQILRSISALDANNVWAVGYAGTILKYNGTTWSLQESGTTQGLSGISALDANNVWTAGSVGDVFKYNGTTWSLQESGTTQTLYGISALDANNIWAVGDVGTILKYNGTTWSSQTSGTTQTLYGISALDANNVWAVGYTGTILKYNGTTWSLQESGTTQDLFSISALDANNVWAVGSTGTILKYNGTTWSSQESGTTQGLSGISALDANNVWTAGSVGDVFKYNGTTWSLQESGTTQTLYGISALDANNIWAVGDVGTILKYNGTTWSSQTSGTTQTLYGISALDANNVWAVGSTGTILKYNGTTWSSQESGTIQALYGISALDANNIWAVGNAGTILKYNGAFWSSQTSGTSQNLRGGVSTLDANNIWAVGDVGTILKYNGTTWSSQTSGTTQTLYGISALDANNVWAVGYAGTILKYNGTTWSLQESGTIQLLRGISALDANNVWVVGYTGTILKYNGTTWSSQTSGTPQNFRGISALDANNIWAVGGAGNILRYLSPTNATATKLSVHLPGQDDFSDGNPITGPPTAVQAGDTVTATIYATNGSDVLDKGNASWAGFTTTDPNDTNPGVIQLTEGVLGQPDTCIQNPSEPTTLWCGRGTANFVFHTPGTWTVTASDVYGVLSAGTSSSITVTAGSAAKLYFSGTPSSLAMGSTSSQITLGVRDTYNNDTTVGSNKTVRLSTSSSSGRFSTSASGPWSEGSLDVTIAAGQGTTNFFYLDFATGASTITAAETPDAGWTDASGAITITSGSLDQSTLTVDKSSVAPGESLVATVTLKNSQGLALADRTVQLLSSRSTDSVSSSIITNPSGSGSFTVTPTETGDLTLTAYDQTDNAYVPQTAGVHVGIGALARIDLTAESSSVNAGKNLPIYLTLYDSYSNVLSDFSGEVSFSSSDEKASFSHSTYNLTAADQGKYSQDVTLNTQGDQSITASIGQIQDTVGIKVLGETEAIPTTTTSTSPTPTSSPIAAPQTLIEKIAESPVAQQIAKTLTPVATAAAALGFLPLLIQAFPQTFHAFASLFPALFAAAAFRRRRKPWGTVFDSLTGKPIELAVVRIFNDNTDKLVATKVTDQNGRFNILVEKGTYYLKVAKPGYLFPARMSKIKAGQLATRFGPETDIYLGQSFVVNTANANINLNVALDPKPNTLSNANRVRKVVKDSLDWFFIGISYVALPMLIIGAVFTALALIIKPTGFNLTLGIIYVLLLVGFLVVKRIRQTQLGLVFDGKTKKPLKNAVVSCFDKEYNALRETRTTDQNGYFSILAPKGEYYLTIDAKGYRFPSKELEGKKEDKILGKLYFGDTIRNKKSGYLKVSIPLDKKY